MWTDLGWAIGISAQRWYGSAWIHPKWVVSFFVTVAAACNCRLAHVQSSSSKQAPGPYLLDPEQSGQSVYSSAQAGNKIVALPTKTNEANGASLVLRPNATCVSVIGYAVLDLVMTSREPSLKASFKREYFLLHCAADDMLAMACLWWKYYVRRDAQDAGERRKENLETEVCCLLGSSSAVLGRWPRNSSGRLSRT